MSVPTSSTLRKVVLVPTYNELPTIEPLVEQLLKVPDLDVWVIDDNSPDGTGVVAQKIADRTPRVTVLHREKKNGLGKAYLHGFKRALEAGYDRIIQMDADFSHPIAQIPRLLELAQTYDVVLGCRWMPGGGTKNWPRYRQLLSRGGSLYARRWLNLPIRDLTGGFKCFRREVLLGINLDGIHTTGYAFQIEVTYRAIKGGFSITETPILFTEREEGTSKMSRQIVLEALLKVPKLRFWLQ
jgi:dolichol-phosphate mannosyltransferase